MRKKTIFQHKRVFITGGSKGIGLSIAKRMLTEEIAAIGVCSRNPEHINDAKKILTDLTGETVNVYAVVCDVTDEMKLKKIVGDFKPDILITSAGINSCAYFEDLNTDDFLNHFKVDTLGVLNSVRAALPYMKQNGGTIVNISSLLSTTPLIGYSAFCAGKGAVQLALEALQNEYAKDGIYFQHVLAPAVETEMLTTEDTIPELTRLFGDEESHDCLPDEFAKYVIRGIKSKRKYITYHKNIIYSAVNLLFNCNKAPESFPEFLKNSFFIVPSYWIVSLKKLVINHYIKKYRY